MVCGALITHLVLCRIQLAVSITVVFGTGDVLTEQPVEKKGIKGYDLPRTGRMAFYGGAIWRLAATRWFRFLQAKIVLQNKTLEMVTHVAIDQTFFAPASLFVFLSSMSIVEGSSPSEKLSKSFITALRRNQIVWPFMSLFNFRFVPLDHRVILVNVIPLGWNCYLSDANSSTMVAYASPMQQGI
ncbi:sym-1 [Lindgomyces ingoldianus]|uniref:Sym-1 n=1 Tax=Lindgomyces ingoldianus TaxID=673940 RepID=A0ACB6R305_9PLEO|nr:sym-1 [Lindgomyces ingoldianus]KAF2473531.1 sym-1 [Lindgomyces ingoldianus]